MNEKVKKVVETIVVSIIIITVIIILISSGVRIIESNGDLLKKNRAAIEAERQAYRELESYSQLVESQINGIAESIDELEKVVVGTAEIIRGLEVGNRKNEAANKAIIAELRQANNRLLDITNEAKEVSGVNEEIRKAIDQFREENKSPGIK